VARIEMTWVDALLITLFILWLFWATYVLIMGFYRAHLNGTLRGVSLVLAVPFIIVGLVVDIVINITLASILFAQFPREWLVTTRLKRYVAAGDGWRSRAANAICNRLLDIFDPSGNHC